MPIKTFTVRLAEEKEYSVQIDTDKITDELMREYSELITPVRSLSDIAEDVALRVHRADDDASLSVSALKRKREMQSKKSGLSLPRKCGMTAKGCGDVQ